MRYTDMQTQNEYDMSPTIIAKSDQVNADDLIGGPMTIKIESVDKRLNDPAGQTVWIHYGDQKKTYKPGLSMRRVIIGLYGNDSREWIGKQLTLFRDPEVPFGSAKVGGVRISHATGITEPKTIMIQTKKGVRKPWTVLPLIDEQPKQPTKPSDKAATWAQGFIERVNACETLEALATLIMDNQKAIERLDSEYHEIALRVRNECDRKRKELEQI